jgi:hypothetical protein
MSATKPKKKDAESALPPMTVNTTELKQAEYLFTSHAVVVPGDRTLEQYLAPSAWAHVAAKINPTDRIHLIAEDMSWVAELFVRSTNRLWVDVAVVSHTRFDKANAPVEDDPYYTKWLGPNKKHCVVRREDNSTVSEGHQTKDDAGAYLADYMKALSR